MQPTSRLPMHIVRFFVVSQPYKPTVPKAIVRRPFGKLELPNQNGPKPAAGLHFFRREALPPSAALGLGEIREGAFVDFEAPEAPHQPCPQRWREPVARSRRVYQPIALVVSEHQRIENLST